MLQWLFIIACLFLRVEAFTTRSALWGVHATGLKSTTQESSGDAQQVTNDEDKRNELKKTMLQLGASYDRGFGASPSAREQATDVIKELELVNEETYAARGITGNETSPLQGNWRMVWTDAQDVLVLAASPVTTVGAIYQSFDLPVVTNIIDLIPRAQALLPPSLSRPTLFRAEVTTRASTRPNQPMRVGLDFEKVKVKPIEVLGVEVGDNVPPLGFDLPRVNIPGTDPETSPGYFDVTFLDDEMLVIRQNAPGGLFVLVKVPENDP